MWPMVRKVWDHGIGRGGGIRHLRAGGVDQCVLIWCGGIDGKKKMIEFCDVGGGAMYETGATGLI